MSVDYNTSKVVNKCQGKGNFTFNTTNKFTQQGEISPNSTMSHNFDFYKCYSFYTGKEVLSNYGFLVGNSIVLSQGCMVLISLSSKLSGLAQIGKLLIKVNPPMNRMTDNDKEGIYDHCIMHYSRPEMSSTINMNNDSLIYNKQYSN